MTPEEIKAKLEAAGAPLTPEQLAALGAAGATPPAVPPTNPTMTAPPGAGTKPSFAATCRKMADAAKTPEEKAMYSAFADEAEEKDKKFSELEKRTGELQASADAAQKKDAEAQMAAFSAQVATECEKIARKVEPRVIEAVVKPTALGILTSKAFSAETERVKAFSDYFAGLAMQPDDPRLAPTPGAPVAQRPSLDGPGRKVIDALAEVAPNTHKRLTAAK